MNFEKLESNYGFNESKSESEPEDNSRRGFLKKAVGAFVAGVSVEYVLDKKRDEESIIDSPAVYRDQEAVYRDEPARYRETETTPRTESNSERLQISSAEFKKIKPELIYDEIHPAIKVENFNVPGGFTRHGASVHEGKIACTMIYKEITDAVENRYNLPRGVLLAMIMQESTGIDLLPNGVGDGGFGVSHMQGSTAAEYGLKTFDGCNALVCNSHRGCRDANGNYLNHAKQLADLMKERKDDRKTLVEADERLHLILNIDAAGRMLASHMSGPKLKGRLSHLDPFETAIARYAGADNFAKYWENIRKFREDFENENTKDDAVAYFNEKNPNIMVNGKHVDYFGYLAEMKKEFENYGLAEYKKLPKYNPANSENVLKSYRDYLV